MRILYVTSCIPWPLNSGMRIRQYNILKALASIGEVDLLAVAPLADFPEEIKCLCRRTVLQPVPKTGLKKRLPWLRSLFQVICELKGMPFETTRIPESQFLFETRSLLTSNYDLTWISRLQSYLRLGQGDSGRSILDLDDIEHRKLRRAVLSLDIPLFKKLRGLISARALEKAERRALHKFARVVVCSEIDRIYLNATNVAVIPNGASINHLPPQRNPVPGRILFIGRMDYPPNDDAMQFFIRHIWPCIQAVDSRAHLWIIGANPSEALKKLADGERICCLGRVSVSEPILSSAVLSVAPLRVGGGTRLKIIESLANKVPVVSTIIGAEGLNLVNGEHIMIADKPESFAAACLLMLSDPCMCQKLAENGYRFVLKQNNWSIISKSICNIVHQVVPTTCRRES